jgi:hypothetical protein
MCTILDHGTTSRSLYSRGNRAQYPLDRKLNGRRNRPGRCEQDKKILSLPWFEPEPSSTLFFLFGYWGVKSILGPLGTAATRALLCLPRVIVRMEKLVE